MRGISNKRGQVTIFIIVALVIVIIGLAIFFFYPKLSSNSRLETDNPEAYIKDCIEDDFNGLLTNLSLQGGSVYPTTYYRYSGNNINYLCYSSEYYTSGIMPIPFIELHIEKQLNVNLKKPLDECFESLKENYIAKGYEVSLRKGTIESDILPERVVVDFKNYELLVKKTGETQKYKSFGINKLNYIYSLINIAKNIVQDEIDYGDSDTIAYMILNPYIHINKIKRTDGTTYYGLEDVDTGELFQFASRSFVQPIGYM